MRSPASGCASSSSSRPGAAALRSDHHPGPDPAGAGSRPVRPAPPRPACTDQIDPDELAGWLVDHGYRRTEAVELPGEFSRAAASSTSFPPTPRRRTGSSSSATRSSRSASSRRRRSAAWPVRDHRITGHGAGRVPQRGQRFQPVPLTGHLCDYLPADAWTVLVEPDDLHEQGKHYLERVADPAGLFSVPGVFQQLLRFPSVQVSALPRPSVEATCHLRVESVERFSGDVGKVRDELDSVAAGDRVLIACHNEAECKRLGEVLAAGQLAQSDRLRLVDRPCPRRLPHGDAGPRGRPRETGSPLVGRIVVLGDQELFHREEARQVLPRRRLESRAIDSFLDLAEGDLVVHVSHGIARYRGMQVLEKNGHAEEHLILEFRDGVRVYVPASKIDLVQKYVGGAQDRAGAVQARRHRLAAQARSRVEAAVLDLASDMIELQAVREAAAGHRLPAGHRMAGASSRPPFPTRRRPTSSPTLAEIKRDMERAAADGPADLRRRRLRQDRAGHPGRLQGHRQRPAGGRAGADDRAGRAALPHLQPAPGRVSRSSSSASAASARPASRERILERLAQGGVDIIIGTHRLVSADVALQGPGPGHHRRGAALRRRAQGAAQAAAADGGRADA